MATPHSRLRQFPSADHRKKHAALPMDPARGWVAESWRRTLLFGYELKWAQLRVIEAPPSTNEAVPVTKAESSEARYSTERASSSGRATRFSAWRLVMNACLSAVSFISWYIPVSTAPGRIALTRTPRGPNSAASAWVSPIRPDLLAA